MLQHIFRKIWSLIGKVNGLLLIIYCMFIFGSYVFQQNIFTTRDSLIRCLWITLVLCVSLCPLAYHIVNKRSSHLSAANQKVNYFGIKTAASTFIISFIILLFYYVAYYPGYFSPDSVWQYNQSINNAYNDWHPVLDTLINFKLPLILSGGWIGSMALFQIVLFALVLTYMFRSVCEYVNIKCAVLILAFVLLNPTTGMMAIYVGKDTCFSICTLYLIVSAMHIYYTKGLWLKKVGNTICFVIILTITAIVRHNAILFAIPFIVAVFLLVPKKKGLIILVSFILAFTVIKFPLYNLLGVEEGEKRQSEMVGLPMNIIGAAVAYNPESLDDDILEFAYRVASKEKWETYYHYGSFNAIKFGGGDTEYIDNYPIAKILDMTVRTIKSSPGVSLTALYKTTCAVYSVTDDFAYSTALLPSDSQIEMNGIPILQSVLDKYRDVSVMLFPHLFMYSGFMLLVLALFTLAKRKLNNWNDWKCIFLVLPVFFYNYGTMFFLTSVWDGVRFFYYTFLLTPILLIMVIKKRE